MSAHVQRANSCNELGLTPRYLLAFLCKHVKVLLLDAYSADLPVPESSICDKNRLRGSVPADRLDGAIRFRSWKYPYNYGV